MEFCPMVMFPTLAVGDVGASVGWCSGVLGFGTVFVLPGADEAGVGLAAAAGALGVGAGLVGGVLGAAEEGAWAALADDHDAGAARLADRGWRCRRGWCSGTSGLR